MRDNLAGFGLFLVRIGKRICSFFKEHISHRLLNKAFFFYIIIQVVFILVIALPMVQIIFGMLKDRELQLNQQIAERVANGFSEKYRVANQINRQIYRNEKNLEDIQQLLNFGVLDYYSYRLDRYYENENFDAQNIERMFTETLDDYKDIQQITLYSLSQRFAFQYEESYGSMVDPSLFTDEIKYIMRNPRNPIIPVHNIVDDEGNVVPVFTIWFNISSLSTKNNIGYIFIDFRADSISETYKEYNTFLRGNLYLVSSNLLIFSSEPDGLGRIFIPETELPDSDARIEVSCEALPLCYVYQSVDLNAIREDYGVIILLINMLVAAFILSTTVFMISMTRFVNNRIGTVISGMEQLQTGNLALRLPTDQADEFSQIALSFNRMGAELEEYIKTNYILRLAQKEAEMKHLEAQINPHFLNNTLETIRMKALADGSQDAADMIFYLSRLFRDMYKDKSHYIPLQHELKNCKEYLNICSIRYGSCFNVEFDIPPEYEDIPIAKFLLQPIVENFIIHGMDRRRKDNNLLIYCRKNSSRFILGFDDTGKGIPGNRLVEVRNALSDTSDNTARRGVGLVNVHRRVQLIYGNQYGIKIDSEPGSGTHIRLELPLDHEAGAVEVMGDQENV